MAGKAKKVTKTIREQLADLKRKQRERMKAAGETPQSLKKKRDQRRAEANRPRTSKASRTTPDGETTVPKRPGKDLVESKPRQLPATIKPANKAVAIRKTFDIKPNVKNSKIEEITKGATSKAERMSKLKKAGLLAAGGATVAAIGVGTGGKKTPTATASTDKGDKKSGTSKTKTTTEVTGKKRRVGTFAPRFRPFGGKIARALLGEDEQFGGEKGGLLDPNLGLGLRRSGRKVVTKKDGKVVSEKRLNPEVSRKKDRKDPKKKNMGGMMKAKGKANGGMMKKKGYAMGGSANLKKAGADQKGLKKLPTAVRNKMGYMNEGGDAAQESAKQAKMMDRLISKMASEYGVSKEEIKKRMAQDYAASGSGGNVKRNRRGDKKGSPAAKKQQQGAKMAKGGMMKKKGYAKGGMAKKGYAKGGAATKVKRTSKRKSSMGAATRGGGAIMR